MLAKFSITNHFAKFRPENYDFNVYKGFFMEKITQIRQTLKGKKIQIKIESSDFYDKL